ncbi:unnamed protein product (macronuclear) [Paramecium tetraurelia]|uniref:Transmembrane protein n=1 Tax=Paramecium tetraurelia TaxID=5888 RepID=A0CUW2_PARTE|nr:uncharacterized protein GSPATT00039034001 [Paramecium tetraurelia]CAK74579.1 unnamed protein product [Paramecium tetraurelia]|eukprot:XP_001441976.1 hypothetical protein (macronuclear) [Paramecium tetraurelia strain d4-2]
MSLEQDQASEDFPLVAFQEEYGVFDPFFNTLKKFGWKQASIDQQCQKLASSGEIMLFFIKVYALLAGMLVSFYLMTFILLFTKSQKLKENETFNFHFALYYGSFAITIALGIAGYVLDKTRQFPLNLIFYFTFTIGAAYSFGYPLSLLLQYGYYSGEDWIILLYFFTMTLGCYACLILFLIRRQSSLNSNRNNFIIYQVIIFSIIGVMIFLLFIFIMTAPYYVGVLIACFFCHVIYGGLLIIDTKLMISGKFSLKTNQYVSGALYLYLDITVLILYFIGCIIYTILKTLLQCLEECCKKLPDCLKACCQCLADCCQGCHQ